MKRLLFLLLPLFTFGQKLQKINGDGFEWKRGQFTSVLAPPLGIVDRNVSGSFTYDLGQIRYDPITGAYYGWDGAAWFPIGGGAATGWDNMTAVLQDQSTDRLVNINNHVMDWNTIGQMNFHLNTASQGFNVDGGSTQINFNKDADVNVQAGHQIDLYHGAASSGYAINVFDRTGGSGTINIGGGVDNIGYINFSNTTGVFGVTGYGFRNNAGIMEFKNSGGGWTVLGNGIYGGNGTLASDIDVNANSNYFKINNASTISLQQTVFELRNKVTSNANLEITEAGNFRLWGDLNNDGTVRNETLNVQPNGSFNTTSTNSAENAYISRLSIGSGADIATFNINNSQITLDGIGNTGTVGQFIMSQGPGLSDIWADQVGGITQLTGDVTAGPGTGSQIATISNDAITTAKILDANVTNVKLANSTISGVSLGSNLSDFTIGTNLQLSSGTTYNGGTAKTISLQNADATHTGALTSTDWSTFNNKGIGTVTSVSTSNGLTGGIITGTGTISGVNSAADGSTKGVASFTTADFDATSGNISIDYTNGQAATSSNKGFLTSSDWTTFNNKISANQTISFSPTGDVTGSTTGTTTLAPALTIGALKVTNSMIANSTIDLTTKITGLLPNANINSVAWGKITSTPTTLSGYGITDAASNSLTSSHLFIGNGSNVATDVAVSGDVTITNAGVTAIGASKVINSMITNSTIDLTAKVSGLLPATNGGTGIASGSSLGILQIPTTIGTYAMLPNLSIPYGRDNTNKISALRGGADATDALTSRTSNTNKQFYVTAVSYASTAASTVNDYIIVGASATSSANTLTFGGGTSTWPAATQFNFFTASAVNTATGTIAMSIDNGQRVGIGTTTPTTTSALDITSTTKGFLPPRHTTTQQNAVTSPATGLEVFNTTFNFPAYYNGTAWRSPVMANQATPSNGQVPIGNGTDYTVANITGSNGITVTNGSGTISLSNSGTYVASAGSFSGVGTATTTFTVTIGSTMANTTYKVNATPTSTLSAAAFYVNNKTTTTFDVVYLAGLTGTVTFDWSVFP